MVGDVGLKYIPPIRDHYPDSVKCRMLVNRQGLPPADRLIAKKTWHCNPDFDLVQFDEFRKFVSLL